MFYPLLVAVLMAVRYRGSLVVLREPTGPLPRITTVRLNVEENQLVNVFDEFGICLGGLKSA